MKCFNQGQHVCSYYSLYGIYKYGPGCKYDQPVMVYSYNYTMGNDDIISSPICNRADFRQLANQGSWAKNTPGKGATMRPQKSGSGRVVEASLSSSPSLKGKRDVMAKHSEAMDFRDLCKNECVMLLGSKGLLYFGTANLYRGIRDDF
ncbi:unnamed protein product [Lactuca virosa]|uniref:Uncharacterized protein n=1 Tax=Lactuca virosa TaxID=75947 RepID=A0AAU9LKF2_9ASTR|nr:unnamed protein product [Lactuca virosa]